MANRRLGRGLDGLLKGQPAQPIPDLIAPTGPTTSVATALLDPNPHQPRHAVGMADVEQLAASIREHGVLTWTRSRRRRVSRPIWNRRAGRRPVLRRAWAWTGARSRT